MKVAICTIAKLEDKYIQEWINYHIAIGVDDFLVVVNNCRKLPYSQSYRYQQIYKAYGNNYDWIFYIDVDEFITLKNNNNVKDVLAQDKFSSCNCIVFNWLLYGDAGLLYRDTYDVIQRFSIDNNSSPSHLVKSAVRGGLGLNHVKNVHTITDHPYTVDGKKAQYKDIPGTLFGEDKETMKYIEAHVSHYITKSTEEYINNKIMKY